MNIHDNNPAKNYFAYLLREINFHTKTRAYQSWLPLLEYLATTKAYVVMKQDENRLADGLALRDEYIKRYSHDSPLLIDGSCSLLELLIGLAKRAAEASFVKNTQVHNVEADYFRTFCHNLGYDRAKGKYESITKRFLNRNYKSNGVGGIFPLTRRNMPDQRTTELWYQMHAWLDEQNR